jgi:hypothetical protein
MIQLMARDVAKGDVAAQLKFEVDSLKTLSDTKKEYLPYYQQAMNTLAQIQAKRIPNAETKIASLQARIAELEAANASCGATPTPTSTVTPLPTVTYTPVDTTTPQVVPLNSAL